jgi:hypothetical protein
MMGAAIAARYSFNGIQRVVRVFNDRRCLRCRLAASTKRGVRGEFGTVENLDVC